MSLLTGHKIKRAARREAWQDPNNPFGRRRTHNDRLGDIEEGFAAAPRRSTEPPVGLTGRENGNGGRNGGIEMQRQRTPVNGKAAGSGAVNGRTGTNGSVAKDTEDPMSPVSFSREDTATSAMKPASSHSTARLEPANAETKARSRFLSKFSRHAHNSNNEKRAQEGLVHPGTGLSGKSKKLKHHKFTWRNQIHASLFNSWINILLIAVPVGIALEATHQNDVAIFVVNFIAIIPLAALLSYATEEIALRVGETLGGLMNATFGNAVELIVSIIALTKDEITIVKTSLIGSILSNLLLVLGMCFFLGGLRREEQFFNTTVAQTAASLLALAIGSVIIPTAFDLWGSGNENGPDQTGPDKVAAISRGTSVILLVVYGAYLYFQLKTHNAMFQAESQKVPMRPRKKHLKPGNIQRGLAGAGGMIAAGIHRPESPQASDGEERADGTGSPPSDEDRDHIMNRNAYEDNPEPEDEEEPQLHIFVALALLLVSTVIVAVCAEFMVGSISAITGQNEDGTSSSGGISAEFVGLILLPIVGNAAEHATAVTVAIKDKMDLAIGVAVGSSMQVSLLVIPFTVILGWCMGKDEMNLSFDGFQVAVLFVSVLLVNYLIA
jgi:Ca2+:H+ antiporter